MGHRVAAVISAFLLSLGAWAQTPPEPTLGPDPFSGDDNYDCNGTGELNPPRWIKPTAPGALHINAAKRTINGQEWRANAHHPGRLDFYHDLSEGMYSVDIRTFRVYSINPDGSGNDYHVLTCGPIASNPPPPLPNATQPTSSGIPAIPPPPPTDDLPSSLE
jgi:hypothetical protein